MVLSAMKLLLKGCLGSLKAKISMASSLFVVTIDPKNKLINGRKEEAILVEINEGIIAEGPDCTPIGRRTSGQSGPQAESAHNHGTSPFG